VNGWTHWVIVQVGYWNRLPTDQPNVNYIEYHDSAVGPYIWSTMTDWKPKISSYGSAVNVGLDYEGNAYTGLQGFYAAGGTYYGDEDPPRCEDCDPLEAGSHAPGLSDRVKAVLAALFQRPQIAAKRATGVIARVHNGAGRHDLPRLAGRCGCHAAPLHQTTRRPGAPGDWTAQVDLRVASLFEQEIRNSRQLPGRIEADAFRCDRRTQTGSPTAP
jgi:hypothetical protein